MDLNKGYEILNLQKSLTILLLYENLLHYILFNLLTLHKQTRYFFSKILAYTIFEIAFTFYEKIRINILIMKNEND